MKHIKNLHLKMNGVEIGSKKVKKLKPKDQCLADDSLSEITDVDEAGILTTSLDKLPKRERLKLRKYAF